MRPPDGIPIAVVLTVALIGGVTVVGADGPTGTQGSDVAERPVSVENGSVYWHGQTLAFSVDSADAYELRTADDGHLVAQLEPSNGSAFLNTTGLSPGEYVLSGGPNASVVYRFEIVRQKFSATASDEGIETTSNRKSYSLAVESPDLSPDQLRSLFPDAVERNGTVVLDGVGVTETLATDSSAVPDGEYAIRLRVRDTGANASISVSISSPEASTTAESTDRATRSTTDRATTGESTQSGTTATTAMSTDVPGFGVPAAVLAVAAVFGIAGLGARR